MLLERWRGGRRGILLELVGEGQLSGGVSGVEVAGGGGVEGAVAGVGRRVGGGGAGIDGLQGVHTAQGAG